MNIHPQSSGLDERFNQTLQRQLLKFVDSEQTNWDAILISYRISIRDSTKYSTLVLVYGRHPHVPIEFNMRSNSYPEYNDTESNPERNQIH